LGKGHAAERLVFDRLRAALPADYRLFPNVHSIARTADHLGIRDGEADVVLAHPDGGFLVFETKAGEIRRDDHRWWWSWWTSWRNQHGVATAFEDNELVVQGVVWDDSGSPRSGVRADEWAPPDWADLARRVIDSVAGALAETNTNSRLLGAGSAQE
jgi:nuclease-like protein